MSLPGFHELVAFSAPELRRLIGDRVRVERRKIKLSQKAFAEKCGIPLRTYKRFEQGECDSLEAFLQITISFERVKALELLFPPKPAAVAEVRSANVLVERLRNRIQNQKKNF